MVIFLGDFFFFFFWIPFVLISDLSALSNSNLTSLIIFFISHMSHPDSNLLSRMSHCDSYPQVTMTLKSPTIPDSPWLTMSHVLYLAYWFVDCPRFVDQWTLFSSTISMASPGHYSPRLDFCILRYRQAIRVLFPLSSPCPLSQGYSL